MEDAGDCVCIIDGNLIEIGSNSNVYSVSTRRFQNDKSYINGQVNPLEDPLLKNSSGILAQDSSTLMVLNYHVFFFCFVL